MGKDEMIDNLRQTISALEQINQTDLDSALELLFACHNRGGIVYICGNGGSAATASHFACDLQKAAGVRAIALTDNVPLITAWANDVGYKDVFYWQLKCMHKPGDVVVYISCSGTSPNIHRSVSAFAFTPSSFVQTIGLSSTMHDVDKWHDVNIAVNSDNYGVIENVHLAICHALTVGLRERLTTTSN